YPPGMESVPRKVAIVRANRYMVDHTDFLIAYAWHPASNAKNLLEYARKREGKGLGCIRKVGSYVQNGEDDSGSSKEKKGLKRIGSLIIACRDTPEIFQATKTALYYIPALVSLPVIFPGMKQILGWWNCILGTLLSK